MAGSSPFSSQHRPRAKANRNRGRFDGPVRPLLTADGIFIVLRYRRARTISVETVKKSLVSQSLQSRSRDAFTFQIGVHLSRGKLLIVPRFLCEDSSGNTPFESESKVLNNQVESDMQLFAHLPLDDNLADTEDEDESNSTDAMEGT